MARSYIATLRGGTKSIANNRRQICTYHIEDVMSLRCPSDELSISKPIEVRLETATVIRP